MRPISFLALVTMSVSSALAGSELRSEKTVVATVTPFDQGKWELQSASGAYFSVGGGDRPTLNYSSTAYRLGLMLQTPGGDGLLRGNCELMLQFFGASIFDGPGNGLGGAAVLLRYNCVQPGARWVPYIQLGMGAAY